MAYLDKEAFGAHKGEEDDAYDGCGDHDDEESDDVEDDQAEEVGFAASPEPGRDWQLIHLSQGFASAKCMYFCKLSQICFHRNT